MVEFVTDTWPFHIHIMVLMMISILGFAAYMSGQALASTWRALWQVYFYAVLLGLTDRFLIFALFERELLSVSGFVIDTAVLTIISLLAYRLTKVHRMVTQYPWRYERAGLFSWRVKDGS